MVEKLFYYLVVGFFGLAFIKIFIYWSLLKLKERPKKNNTLVKAEAEKVSLMFNKLLKAKALTRADILIIRNILKKYTTKRYENDCHLIYSVLKHENVRLNDLGSIQVFLESKKIKSKI